MQQALTRIEDGSATPEASWEKFVADVQALG
jgi:cellobiose transport system substrate-binding protein